MNELPLLALAALLAGFIDAVAGGGGLVQVPALLAALPGQAPATLFGTNKISSIVGTANAAWRYARRIEVPWALAVPAAVSAFVFSFAGAATVAWLPREVVRPLVLALLVTVVVYAIVKPEFGRVSTPRLSGRQARVGAGVAGAALGFYDGFFGPGAGSFMIFAFVALFGLDFLRASAAAKVVNLATNAAALAFFAPTGHVLWSIGLVMALFNMAGAAVGARLALRHGSGFVRWIFLVVSVALTVKFGYDTLLPKA
jgi:uncharacterized membrane protein YfcA